MTNELGVVGAQAHEIATRMAEHLGLAAPPRAAFAAVSDAPHQGGDPVAPDVAPPEPGLSPQTADILRQMRETTGVTS